MERIAVFGLALLLGSVAFCKSKEDKINECQAKCAELDKEFEKKCPELMLDADSCKKKVEETGKGCRDTCSKAFQ